MKIIQTINGFLKNFDYIIRFLELFVTAFGVYISVKGKKALKDANEIYVKVEKLVENIEILNPQIARTINNGLSLKDVDYQIDKQIKEKTKNKPDIVHSQPEPQNGKLNDTWMQEYK